MSPLLLLPLTPRFIALTLAILSTVGFAIALAFDQQSILLAICFSVALFLTIVGTIDLFQTSHSVLRNYPILAHFRFIFEGIRPELRQYFFEGDKDGMPFSRDRRAVAYQRAKMALDVRPFGTHYDATLHELAEMTAAAGFDHPREFKPIHISRRISPSQVATFADMYPSLAEGELIAGSGNPRWRQPWDLANAHSFRAVA